MSGLTPTGFDRKRLVDILSDIETAQKAIFGENIDLNSESRFGQLNGILSEAISDAWESQEDVYESFIPASSSGVSLSDLVQLNGIRRDDGDNSTVTATITGTVGLVIPAGSQASVVGTEAVFETLASLTIPAAGFDDVAMASVDEGEIAAEPATLTQIETPIFGWTAITNASAANLGNLEETDAELKVRREISTAAGGNNLADACAAQLKNLDGVTDAIVIDNKTDAVDANGLDPHTFAPVIIGGAANAIANVVWSNTPQGINSFGSLTENITDGQGFTQVINYSLASDIDIHFKFDLTTDSDYPGDGDAQVKAAAVAHGQANFGIFDDVILSAFYTPINTIPGIIGIVITMNVTGAPIVETANITIAFDEISRYDIANISIT